ncbi:MAG: hypothetical protein ACOYK8_02790 [Alphaproteobacteria bacterium]
MIRKKKPQLSQPRNPYLVLLDHLGDLVLAITVVVPAVIVWWAYSECRLSWACKDKGSEHHQIAEETPPSMHGVVRSEH